MRYAVAYARFEILRAVRNRRYLLLTMVMPVVFYLAFSGSNTGDYRIDGVPFVAYFLVSMIAYSAIGSAFNAGGARLAAERKSGWLTQLKITPLSSAGFVGAKVATAVAVALPGTILVGLVGRSAHGVHLDGATWVQLYATVWLGVIPFAALGMAIGYALGEEAAQAGSVAALFLLSILGGLWAPLSNFPTVLQEIGKTLPTYLLGHASRAALAHASPSLIDVLGLAAWTVVFSLALAYFYRRDDARSGA